MIKRRFTNVGGYTGKVEAIYNNNLTTVCRIDVSTEPKRFRQAVRFFKRKYNRKERVSTDMWSGSQAQIIDISFDLKRQQLKFEVLKA